MELDVFAAVMADEREALDTLLFKLEEEHLVLASGRHRWLRQASAEVAVAVSALEVTERRRIALADAVVGMLGLPVRATLEQIATAAPDTHRARLTEIRAAAPTEGFALVRMPRLSVMPVPAAAWSWILAASRGRGR